MPQRLPSDCRQPGVCPLLDQPPLELGQRCEDMENEFAGRRRRVDDTIAQGFETDTALA
jgi:hypothetical protein